jgi:hypothetical protein
VLLDPEQVVGLINDNAITEFCAKHEVEAFVAIWERVSETIVARQFTSQGIRVDVMLMRGQSMNPPVNPPTDLLREPGPAGLKAFLASGHAPIGEVFGNISGALLKLDETLLAPKR